MEITLKIKKHNYIGNSNMPIEPLRCKVCGGLLDVNLKCQHCGTLHERIENRLEIIKVCPKHLIGYSSLNCPKCVEEQQALILYNQEQARLSAEREEALRKERLKRTEQARLEREQWKKNNYPKLKKIGTVAMLCLIIGIAGLCLSTENYIAHNVNAMPYSSTTYLPPNIPVPTPIPTPTPTLSPTPTPINSNITWGEIDGWYLTSTPVPEISSSVTILNEYGLSLAVQYVALGCAATPINIYGQSQWDGGSEWVSCINITAPYALWDFGVYSGNSVVSQNLLASDVAENSLIIPLAGASASYAGSPLNYSSLTVGGTYLITISITPADAASALIVGNATFTVNSIPPPIQISVVHASTPTPAPTLTPTPQPTPQPTGTYVTHTAILNGTYSFNQAMSKVSASATGITEILLIVIGVLILVAVTIVVYAKSRYELE